MSTLREIKHCTRELVTMEDLESLVSLGHWEYHLDSDVTYWSPEMYRIHGLSDADGVPDIQNLTQMVHPEDRNLWLETIGKSSIAKSSFELEFRIVLPEGTIRYIRSKGGVKFVSNEYQSYVVYGILRDITEEVKESRKRNNRESLLMSVNTALNILISDESTEDVLNEVFEIIGNAGKFLYVQIFEYQNRDYSAEIRPVRRFMWSCKHNPIETEKILTGNITRELHIGDLLNGTCFQMNGRITFIEPIRIANEIWAYLHILSEQNEWLDPEGVQAVLKTLATGIGENILKSKHIEYIKKSRVAAEKAMKARSDFLAGMSHEIRTPMNGVIGMIELLSDTFLTEEQQMYADIIKKSSENLLTIVNDILDFSKIDANKINLEEVEFPLYETIEEVFDLLQYKASGSKIILNYNIARKVPKKLFGDQGRVRQILINFIDNAIKYSREGEITVYAETVQNSRGHRDIKFSVSDTGPGIPHSVQKKLFQPFEQYDGGGRPGIRGTGLGLAISSKLAKLMMGDVGLESQEGKGSTFWFTIPLQTVSPDFESTGRKKILLYTVLESRKRSLKIQTRNLNQVLHVVKNPEELYYRLNKAEIQELPYDLIIIDAVGSDIMESYFLQRIKDRLDLFMENTVIILPETNYSRKSGFPEKATHMFSYFKHSILLKSGKSVELSNPHLVEILPGNERNRVLLVEDDPINQMIARSALEKLGLHVDTAGNGKEAVSQIEANGYDLVFMDLEMPVMNGFEATTQIRKESDSSFNRNIPIIAMTAHSMEEIKEKCIQAGMNGFIGKPVIIEELQSIFEKFLD